MIAIVPWNVQAAFCRRLDCLILRWSFYGMEQNETPKSIFISVTELISWDKKQTKKHDDLKKLSNCYIMLIWYHHINITRVILKDYKNSYEVSICYCRVCVCVCLFPSTVAASPDRNKTINVMPEIRPAMLCSGNHFVSSTFITIS